MEWSRDSAGLRDAGPDRFRDCSGYAAIGTVCNLAARLCAEAKDGRILVAQRGAAAVNETTVIEEIGALALTGPFCSVLARI